MPDRTPTDYALEHAEYMATTAEDLIEAVNALGAAQVKLEDEVDHDDEAALAAAELAVEHATGDLSEALSAMRNRIYEFRKRRDRAAREKEQKA